MVKISGPARCLRSYRRVANIFHDCYFCSIPIMPGEMYRAEVWVQDRKLYVRKFHDFCPEDPYDEEERIRRESEDQEDTESSEGELKEAA